MKEEIENWVDLKQHKRNLNDKKPENLELQSIYDNPKDIINVSLNMPEKLICLFFLSNCSESCSSSSNPRFKKTALDFNKSISFHQY